MAHRRGLADFAGRRTLGRERNDPFTGDLGDIWKTGTTNSLWSTAGNKPIVATSGFYDASAACDQNNTLTAGTDHLRIGVTQIGSTVAGSDLVVGILWYET